MTTAPVVVLTDVSGNPYDSNFIEVEEDTIYPAVLQVTDPDNPGAYFPDDAFVISGPDAEQFYIVDTQLIFNYAPDYESPLDQGADNTYEISVRVTDPDGDTTDQDIFIKILDNPNDNDVGGENQPPQFVSDPFAFVPENTGDVAYTAQVDNSGPGNAEDVTFAIVDGPDANLFSIDPVTGDVFFNDSPDYEHPADVGGDNIYDIVIEAMNQQSGLSSLLDVAIFVDDENDEAPELAPDDAVTVPENTTDVVYVASATDADAFDSATYAISGGADSDKLSIDPHTGEVSFIQAPDFEMPADADGDNTYDIEIVATDDAGNESQVQSVSIMVEDGSDETPVITSTESSVEILENSYDAIYTVEAIDTDAVDTVTFRFADDSPDAGYFMFDEFSGVIYPIMPFDHENPQDEDGDNVYELVIIASDGAHDSDPFTLFVTVLNENDNVPVINADADQISVPENTTGTIYVAGASDGDGDSLEYSLSGADAQLFVLDPSTGELSFITPPDFEHPTDAGGDNVYDVEITASDGDNISDALALAIEVTDVNENGAPPAMTSHDFNGDGTSDILVRNSSSGFVSYGEMHSGSVTWNGISGLAADWQIAGTADLNGDGTSDILVRNAASGYLSFGEMHNGAVTWHGIDNLASDWQIAGTADLNGDGTSDILVRNSSSGFLSYGEMHSGSVTWHGIAALSSDWMVIS